jgi:hypothetical protein
MQVGAHISVDLTVDNAMGLLVHHLLPYLGGGGGLELLQDVHDVTTGALREEVVGTSQLIPASGHACT